MPAGFVLIGLSVFSLGYALIDNPALDQRKPIWVLGAERGVFGESRDPRTRAEIKRRLDAVPADPDKQAALAEIALRYSGENDAHPDWHDLSVRVIGSGWVKPDRARSHVLGFLDAFLAADTIRRDTLRKAGVGYLGRVSLERPAIEPLLGFVEQANRRALDTGDNGAIKAWALSPERAVLSAWAERDWDDLAFADQVRLAGDFTDRCTLSVEEHVRSGDAARFIVRIDSIPITFGGRHWTSLEMVEARVAGQRYPLHHVGMTGGGGPGVGGGSAFTSSVSLGASPPGRTSVEIDVRVGHHITGRPDAVRVAGAEGARPETEWPLITLRAETTIVPSDTPDATATLATAERQRALLDHLEMAPLSRTPGGDVTVSVRIVEAPWEMDYRLVMEQGELSSELSTVRASAGNTHHMTMSSPVDDRIDLESPVSLVLVPTSTIAIDAEGEPGAGGRFELGRFVIEPADERSGFRTPLPVREIRIEEGG